MKFIVQRSRLCLDYAITCHLFHLMTVSVVNRQFPLNICWWLVIICSAWLMTEKSRSLCVFQELLPISTKNPNPNPNPNAIISGKSGSGSDGKDNIKDDGIFVFQRINEFIKKIFGNKWWSLRKKSDSNSNSKLNLIQYNTK